MKLTNSKKEIDIINHPWNANPLILHLHIFTPPTTNHMVQRGKSNYLNNEFPAHRTTHPHPKEKNIEKEKWWEVTVKGVGAPVPTLPYLKRGSVLLVRYRHTYSAALQRRGAPSCSSFVMASLASGAAGSQWLRFGAQITGHFTGGHCRPDCDIAHIRAALITYSQPHKVPSGVAMYAETAWGWAPPFYPMLLS